MSRIEKEARQRADSFRTEHRLGSLPLGDLVALVEQTMGIDVAVLDAGADEHGLTMRDPARGRTFIGIARTRHPMRQRSTLAHELGHILFDGFTSDADGRRTAEERRADSFARHLLAPLEGVQQFLGPQRAADVTDLSDVVQWFLVSPAIAAIQMRDAGYIKPEVCEEWRFTAPALATRFGWRDHYDTLSDESYRLRAPQALLARAIAGYAQGLVSAQMIATLRNADLAQIERELEEAGITPTDSCDAQLPWMLEASALPAVDIDLSELDDEADER